MHVHEGGEQQGAAEQERKRREKPWRRARAQAEGHLRSVHEEP